MNLGAKQLVDTTQSKAPRHTGILNFPYTAPVIIQDRTARVNLGVLKPKNSSLSGSQFFFRTTSNCYFSYYKKVRGCLPCTMSRLKLRNIFNFFIPNPKFPCDVVLRWYNLTFAK